VFAGDINQFLIYQVCMLTKLTRARAMEEAHAKRAERVICKRCDLNALSIADITRIPRARGASWSP
jgi:hypothetical protein